MAREMGVSPRRLSGWEPARVTSVERFWWGGVRRRMTVQEPEFSDEDVALLLASRRADDAPRGSHGLLLSVATDPENRYRFEVPDPQVDFAARALNNRQEEFRKLYPDDDLSDRLWSVQLRD